MDGVIGRLVAWAMMMDVVATPSMPT